LKNVEKKKIVTNVSLFEAYMKMKYVTRMFLLLWPVVPGLSSWAKLFQLNVDWSVGEPLGSKSWERERVWCN